MATPECGFCDTYVGPLLASALSTEQDGCLREHAAACACCALRVAAAERLVARGMIEAESVPVAVRLVPIENRRLRHARSPRRRGLVAALSLTVAFLVLATDRGPLAGSPGHLAEAADGVVCRPDQQARDAEASARLLAACGSPVPDALIPGESHPPGPAPDAAWLPF